jgi:hypothetical protein
MSSSSSFVLKKHVKFQEGEQCWILPTTCPPTKLKPRMVCCQEGENDEDMIPSVMTIDYKYVGSPIVLYWEDHNLSIRSEIKDNEYLMERIFYKISNESSLTSISCRQGL